MFKDLFDIPQTGNRIDIIWSAGREHIRNTTVNWWQSHGWEVVLWDNTKTNLALGQNRVVDDWRNSDRDLLIMAHDDITLYPHRYLTAEWLKKPIKHGVYTLNSNHQMFHEHLNSTGWDDGAHHWTKTDQICKMFVIDNKQVPRFDETLPAIEDADWAWQCWSQGIPCYRLETAFLREQSMWTHSTYANKDNSRGAMMKEHWKHILKKWNVEKKSEFRKKYGICP